MGHKFFEVLVRSFGFAFRISEMRGYRRLVPLPYLEIRIAVENRFHLESLPP